MESCFVCARAGHCKVVTAEKVLNGFWCRRFKSASEAVLDGREVVVREIGVTLATKAIATLRKN
jgi:hypothetical protein